MNCRREDFITFTDDWGNTQFDSEGYNDCVNAWNEAERKNRDYQDYAQRKIVESNVAKRTTISAVTQALRDLQNPDEKSAGGSWWIIAATIAAVYFFFLRR